MSTFINRLSQVRRHLSTRATAICGGGLLTAIVVWIGSAPTAALLQSALASKVKGDQKTAGFDLYTLGNTLASDGLWIVLGLSPLAFVWGAAAMLGGSSGGKHGPTIIGGAILAVVLAAAAKGIAA